MNPKQTIVFSDLDGALLDEKTFEWAAARSVLERLKQAGIPLVFISSKTRAEIATLRAQMGNRDPFAAENGAVIVERGRRDLVLGRSARELEHAAVEIAHEVDAEIELFSRMTRRRAMEVSGLSDCQVGPARRRAYSAPFLITRGLDAFRRAAAARRLRLIEGPSMVQLVGDHDKGDAVREIRRRHPHALTVGIGESPNDVPMLQAVDRPILLGRHPPPGLPEGTHLESRSGPAGWSHAVWANLKARQRPERRLSVAP